MSNGTRRPTVRRNLHRQNTTNGLTLAPPSFLPASIASHSTNNIEHGSVNTSQEQTKKQKKIEDLEDQVVPQDKCGTKHPVIEHNGFDDYYRSRVDAPIFRYTSSNNNNNNNNNSHVHNEDRQTSQTNSNGTQINPILVE